eukprot:747677-Hanusia_phi.AAC.1
MWGGPCRPARKGHCFKAVSLGIEGVGCASTYSAHAAWKILLRVGKSMGGGEEEEREGRLEEGTGKKRGEDVMYDMEGRGMRDERRRWGGEVRS